MSNKTLTILILVALAIGAIGIVKLAQTQGQKTTQESAINPTPTASSRPAPVAIGQFRGNVVAASNTSLTVTSKEGTSETFTLTSTVDMQRLISGKLEEGNAKTEKAKLSDLKAGQEVLVVTNKDKGDVRAILIIK